MKSFLLALILSVLVSFASAAGRCQKLTSWAERMATGQTDILAGYLQPICYNILTQAGFTHYWIEDTEIIDGDPNGTCLQSSVYSFDSMAYTYSHIFIDDWERGPQPSTVCQQMQVSTICLFSYKKCDPERDTEETGHVTAKENRVCRWLCDALARNPLEGPDDVGVDGVFCDINDRNYLKKFDIVTSTYADGCNDDSTYSDEEGCIAPKILPTRSVAPKCEEYRGTKCAGIFPSGSLIYLPTGAEQDELEASLSFESLFLSLPPDNKACAASLQRLFCQAAFPECLEYGLKTYPVKQFTTEIDLTVTGTRSTHALPLRTQVEACLDFREKCFDLPFFQHPMIAPLLTITTCENDHQTRKDGCFPTNIPMTWAKDYVRPSSFEQMGTNDADINNNHHLVKLQLDKLQQILEGRKLSQSDTKNDETMVEEDDDDYIHISKIPQLTHLLQQLVDSNQNTTLTALELSNILSSPEFGSGDDQNGQSSDQNGVFGELADPIDTTDPNYQRFTTAQLTLINTLNQIYHFNSKSYLNQYETISSVFLGPPGDERFLTRYALYGEIYAAFYPNVSPEEVIVATQCPDPLVFPTDPNAIRLFNGVCSIPCPSPRFTSKQKFTIELVSLIFVCLALLFSLILSVTFVIFRSQRHKRNLFWYTITYFFAALSMFIGLMNRHGSHSVYENQCESNTHMQHMTGFVLFQSMMSVYFFIASSCWWCMQAVELFEKLILGRTYRRGTVEYHRRQIAFHVFCWGIPLISVSALLCGGQLGYDGFLPFGLAAQNDQMSTKLSWPLSWFFFFLPIALSTLVGLVLVLIIFYFLTKYEHSAGLTKFNEGMEKSSSIWFKIQQSLKLFGFVFLMIPFIVLFAVHQSYAGANEQRWNSLDTEWGQMVLIVGLAGAGKLNHGMEPARVIITVFGFCTPGLVMFLLWFIFDTHVPGLWCGLLYYKLGVSFLKSWASEDTITGSNSGGSTNSGSGSQGSTDLFSAMIGLTKKSRKAADSVPDDTGSAGSGALVTSQSSAGFNKDNNDATTSGSVMTLSMDVRSTTKSPVQAEKAAAQRRTVLFKGFSKATSPSPSRGSGFTSTQCNPTIELGSIVDGDENADANE